MRISDWSSDVCSSDLIDFADHRIGIDLDTIEIEPRGKARIGEPLGRVGEPGRVPVDREQGDAVGIIGAARGARGDDDHVGDMRVGGELRSEGRRGGKEGVSTWRSRWSAYHSKKQAKRYQNTYEQ